MIRLINTRLLPIRRDDCRHPHQSPTSSESAAHAPHQRTRPPLGLRGSAGVRRPSISINTSKPSSASFGMDEVEDYTSESIGFAIVLQYNLKVGLYQGIIISSRRPQPLQRLRLSDFKSPRAFIIPRKVHRYHWSRDCDHHDHKKIRGQ